MRNITLFGIVVGVLCVVQSVTAETLPNTKPLDWEGDLASRMVDGVDRFLLLEIDRSVAARAKHWKRDVSSAEAYEKSIEPNRKRLAHILGVRDDRVKFDAPELVATTEKPPLVGRGDNFDIFAIRWPVLADPDPNRENVVVHGEGLLLVPRKTKPVADIIAIPDADQTPEMICGLGGWELRESEYARRLAESGCRVIVPTLISRQQEKHGVPGRGKGANVTNREYIYRSAFELGRHVIGYELQKVFALVDWLERDANRLADSTIRDPKIGVIGYGEGGMLAMYAGALDTRIDTTGVLGFFGPREGMWDEPLDRNVFGLLEQFGASELAAMILPRNLVVQDSDVPNVVLPPNQGGAPAKLKRPDRLAVHGERERVEKLVGKIGNRQALFPLVNAPLTSKQLVAGSTLAQFLVLTNPATKPKPPRQRSSIPESTPPLSNVSDGGKPKWNGSATDASIRQQRQFDELDQFNQLLLRESPFVRKQFMSKLDTSSVEAYEKSAESYRDTFRNETIGRFDLEALPFNPRTRKSWETEKWTGYEVVLDLWEDVFASGVLLVPKDLKMDGSEKRPVVVCQHGLEGRPTDTFLDDQRAYHDFAAKLAERGFITFAPQNLYIFKDRFRTLQRKANPLGKTLFSVIVPQHQQIVDWLQSLPYVDPDRVAFYGLSYGGKTAMRVPALVTDYCLSICSADFNEWVLKNASTRHPFSYVWTGEYEIFEFDLGSTFNYSEMAALICPRPFMVERGHFDGVGWDEWVGYEYAKVRHLYQAKLHIGDQTEIEWFVGPHTINGQKTYEFLHKHLDWPKN